MAIKISRVHISTTPEIDKIKMDLPGLLYRKKTPLPLRAFTFLL
jgi:hypothetical protein